MTDSLNIPLDKDAKTLLDLQLKMLYGNSDGIPVADGQVFMIDGKVFKAEPDGLHLKVEEQWIPVTIDWITMSINLRTTP